MDLKRLKDTPPWEWPEDAGRVFLEVILNRELDTPERVLAAVMAGDYTVINDDLAGTLLAVVKDDTEDDELRSEATTSLGTALENAFIMGFDDPDDILVSESLYNEIRATLQTLYMSQELPKIVRRKILEGSVRSPEQWHPEAVREAYAQDDREWRLTAVFCMRFVDGFSEQILETLENEDPEFRYHAVRAAEAWEVEAAWLAVRRILEAEDEDKRLLIAAMDASVTVNPNEAGTYLHAFTKSRDDDLVEAAFEAMGMIEALTDNDRPDGDGKSVFIP